MITVAGLLGVLLKEARTVRVAVAVPVLEAPGTLLGVTLAEAVRDGVTDAVTEGEREGEAEGDGGAVKTSLTDPAMLAPTAVVTRVQHNRDGQILVLLLGIVRGKVNGNHIGCPGLVVVEKAQNTKTLCLPISLVSYMIVSAGTFDRLHKYGPPPTLEPSHQLTLEESKIPLPRLSERATPTGPPRLLALSKSSVLLRLSSRAAAAPWYLY
jgi:hypothetical protein